jgi:hypothetical protein
MGKTDGRWKSGIGKAGRQTDERFHHFVFPLLVLGWIRKRKEKRDFLVVDVPWWDMIHKPRTSSLAAGEPVALGALPSFHKVLARRFAAGASAGVHLVRVDVARSDVLTILGATGLLAGVPMAMNALIGLHEMLATRLAALSKAAVVGGTCTHATTHGHAAAQHHTALRRLIVHSTSQGGCWYMPPPCCRGGCWYIPPCSWY